MKREGREVKGMRENRESEERKEEQKKKPEFLTDVAPRHSLCLCRGSTQDRITYVQSFSYDMTLHYITLTFSSSRGR